MLLSERTAKYFEALAREGDRFDFNSWLHRVREEEATGQRSSTAVAVSEPLVATEELAKATQFRIPVIARSPYTAARITNASRRGHQDDRERGRTRRVNRRLAGVRDAWDDFQGRRARDAVYGYLQAVFDLVQRYRGRARTKMLLRHAFKSAGLPLNSTADPFTAVIRCTSDAGVDRKTISKWARALRYAALCKSASLKRLMQAAGGVNACANLYAIDVGRRQR